MFSCSSGKGRSAAVVDVEFSEVPSQSVRAVTVNELNEETGTLS